VSADPQDLVQKAYQDELNDLRIFGDNAAWDPTWVTRPTFTLLDHTLIVTWRAARSRADGVPVPNTATVAGVSQHWSIGFPGAPLGDWLDTIGTSSHTAYVLAGAPANGVNLYHTVVDVGTRAASGLSASANRDQIIANVKTLFRSDVRQVEGAQQVLTYYNKWTVIKDPGSSRTTATLLKTGDGNCEAWVDFFRNVLRTQGIGNTVITDYKMAPRAAPVGLLFVKRWAVKPGGALLLVYPADGRGPVDFANNAYRWIDGESGVRKISGVAGKGNQNPLAMFDSHVIVEITAGAQAGLFDPSYGILGTDFPDYAVQAFDFVGVLKRIPGTMNAGVDLTRVTRENANDLIRRLR
jgi:hypothetical protein